MHTNFFGRLEWSSVRNYEELQTLQTRHCIRARKWINYVPVQYAACTDK